MLGAISEPADMVFGEGSTLLSIETCAVVKYIFNFIMVIIVRKAGI